MSKKRLFVSGYRSYELGIFRENDPKIPIIKKVLREKLLLQLDNGLEWVLTGGQQGTEFWTGEVVLSLQKDFPELKLGIILPYTEFGSQWKPENQEKLNGLKLQANYVGTVSHQPYFSPQQLKNYTRFLIDHSDEALLLYDPEFPGKSKFLFDEVKRGNKEKKYEYYNISISDLEEAQNSFEY